MLKKIVLGVVVVGLSSVLVVGAINRTNEISDRSGTTSTRSQGMGAGGQNSSNTGAASEGQRGYGGNFSDSSQEASSQSIGKGQNGRGGQGQTSGNGNQESVLQAEIEEWLQLEGSVQNITDGSLTLMLTDGEQLLVEGRAWKYALESNFTTEAGHQVVVTGFYEDGEFKFGSLEDLSTGVEVALRDASGRPMWSGGWGRAGA